MRCPKCSVDMEMLRELEKGDAVSKLVRVYYRCRLCGHKVLVEEIRLNAGNGVLSVVVRPVARVATKVRERG